MTTLGQRLAATFLEVRILRDELVQTQCSIKQHQATTRARFEQQDVQITRIAGLFDEQTHTVRDQAGARPSGKFLEAVAWIEREAAQYLSDDQGALTPRQGSLL